MILDGAAFKMELAQHAAKGPAKVILREDLFEWPSG